VNFLTVTLDIYCWLVSYLTGFMVARIKLQLSYIDEYCLVGVCFLLAHWNNGRNEAHSFPIASYSL
jgi:hypothetical protein